MHDIQLSNSFNLSRTLYSALECGDATTLALQPIVSIDGQRLVAVTVLARCTHPRLGDVPPDSFIQITETIGLIIPLGYRLLDLIVRQAALWHVDPSVGCPQINVSISSVATAPAIHCKPDRSFIVNATNSIRDTKMRQGVVGLVHELDFAVVYASSGFERRWRGTHLPSR
jgi:EAL domain-containing protein (putative c-di-GMP-specific phosphodiesterase class I)